MIEMLKADNDNLRYGSDVPTEQGFGEVGSGSGSDENHASKEPRRASV
jgi:hypothetical protein